MGEHQDVGSSRRDEDDFGRLWYWVLRRLIATAPLLWILAIALLAWNWLGPDVPNGTINLITGMAITGTLAGLVAGHLKEDRLLRRELISNVEQLTRAPGDRALRLLKSDPLAPGAHVAPSPRRTPH